MVSFFDVTNRLLVFFFLYFPGWSRVRFICFWGSITSMVSACILAGVLIFLMPRNCDPNVEWYQGKVIMDIRPTQNGPNGTTILDLDQIKNRLINYRNMGISTLHLKDLADKNSSNLLASAQNSLGSSGQIEDFFDRIHKENMTIIVQVQSMFFVVLFCFKLCPKYLKKVPKMH